MRRYSLIRNDGRLWIDGQIGSDRVSAAAVRRSLHEVDPTEPVAVVLDSQGGSCAEGLAIYTVLRECGRRIEVTIRNAYSMGAIIAAAGHRVVIEETGRIGLHTCRVSRESAGLDGEARYLTADHLRRFARGLYASEANRDDADRVLDLARFTEAADATALDILTRRTGLPRDRIAGLMRAETMLDAKQAVAMGFADAVVSEDGAVLRVLPKGGGAEGPRQRRPSLGIDFQNHLTAQGEG